MVNSMQRQKGTQVTNHIEIKTSEEACSLDLAPTSSTTSVMAFGDALAVTLLQAKGFTKDDFAMELTFGQGANSLLGLAKSYDPKVGSIGGYFDRFDSFLLVIIPISFLNLIF